MISVIAGVFLVLHGLVHLLYFGQSARLFELKAGMLWPDDSWAFSGLLGTNRTRTLASIFCILATVGFVVGRRGDPFGSILVAHGRRRSGRAFRDSLRSFLGWPPATPGQPGRHWPAHRCGHPGFRSRVPVAAIRPLS